MTVFLHFNFEPLPTSRNVQCHVDLGFLEISFRNEAARFNHGALQLHDLVFALSPTDMRDVVVMIFYGETGIIL